MHDTILRIIRSYVPHPDLADLVDQPSTTLKELRIDQPALIGMSMEIEDETGVEITHDETHAWGTVADVLECVAGKVGVVA